MSSGSLARGRNLLQMSMVKTVLELLNMDVMELMRAASSAASMMPRIPAETRSIPQDLGQTGLFEFTWGCSNAL